MKMQPKFALYRKSCKCTTDLIDQANGSKVVYLSADPHAGPFKGWFPLACWILCNITSYSDNMIG